MKKTLIALAVVAAAGTTTVNAAELYNQDGNSVTMGGRAEARLSLKDGKADDKSRIRLNFLGKAEISENLYGVGFWEGEFTTSEQGGVDNSNSLNTRYGYGGIGGSFGEVAYGKTAGALGVITDFTDIMAYHGNSAAYKIAVADRSDNMISYNGQFSDLALKASYRFSDRLTVDENGVSDPDGEFYSDNKADGFSLSGIYAIGDTGIKLGGGYADQNTGTNASKDQYMLAASYSINDLYFAGTFVDGQEKDSGSKTDKTGYEFAAAYTMGKTVFTTSYNYLEAKASGIKEDAADNVAVDATYYFKPNFRSYISYNFNLLDSDKVGKVASEDELALGLRYDF
ncbi:porin [Vibrio lamellibrachiae]|uniref:porin n=1 Tax=Vibrio lamellibrachiae TaxID=2910253 RepID=UPI003D0C6403